MKINGKSFKDALKKNNITQEKAGEMLGVARQTVGIWMKSSELSNDTIERIKNKLGLTLTPVEDTSNETDLPPVVEALLRSKDDMIQELKDDKERLFKLVEKLGNQK